ARPASFPPDRSLVYGPLGRPEPAPIRPASVDFLWRIQAYRGITSAELWTVCGWPKDLEIASRNLLCGPARRAEKCSHHRKREPSGGTPGRKRNWATGTSSGCPAWWLVKRHGRRA